MCRTRHSDTRFAIGIILIPIIAARIVVMSTLVVNWIPDETFRTTMGVSRASKRRIGSRDTCVSEKKREKRQKV